MKRIYLLIIPYLHLTGCAKNVALLGTAYTIVQTGSIQQAFIYESLNQVIKKETGKTRRQEVSQCMHKDIQTQVGKNKSKQN